MAGWLTPYYAYAFFLQLCVVLILATRRGGNRFATGILAALFACNALVTGATFLRLSIGVDNGSFIREMHLFDAPTAFLIFGYVAARSDAVWGPRIATGILALAGVLAYLHQPWIGVPFLSDPGPAWLIQMQQHILGGLFHLSILVAVVVLSRGSREERWVALALAPRFIFWALHSLNEGSYAEAATRLFTTEFMDPAMVHATAAFVLLYGLPLVLVALAWSLRGPEAPPAVIVITAVAIAGMTALVNMNETWRNVWVGVMANLVTLVFIRSFFVMAGLVPERLGVAFARPLLPATIFSFIWLLYEWNVVVMGPGQVSIVMGAVLAFTAFALMEHFWPRLTDEDGAASGLPPAGTVRAATRAAAANPQDPQWTRLLTALSGSADHTGVPPPAWTQQGLAELTGISVKRVSDLPKQLNDRAEQRLDQWVPEWRGEADDVPELVTKHRGIVEGISGPRVYYRLTDWGERLRVRVAESGSAETVERTGRDAPAGAAPV